MPQNTFGFNKTVILFAMAVAVIVGAAIVATMPPAGTVQAHESSLKVSPCHTEQVALDEGYGVSRMVMRRVCDDL